MPHGVTDLRAEAELTGDVRVTIGVVTTRGWRLIADAPATDPDTGLTLLVRHRSVQVPAGVFAAASLVNDTAVTLEDEDGSAPESWVLRQAQPEPPDGAVLRLFLVQA